MTDKAAEVFVIHGRNEHARLAMFAFLRSLGLTPIEWSRAITTTGHASPFVGDVVDAALEAAQAVVVLLTPDEIAYLRQDVADNAADPECEPQAQARPNVLFEAGMAIGKDAARTVIVELGETRPFSDIAGRHTVRMSNDLAKRKALAQRLRAAGCSVDMRGEDWLGAGDFTAPPPPGNGLPVGRRLPAGAASQRRKLDTRYHDHGKGSGQIEIVNRSSEDLLNVGIELPDGDLGLSLGVERLPVPRLPSGKSHSIYAARHMGSPDYVEFVLTATALDGSPVREDAFVSLTA